MKLGRHFFAAAAGACCIALMTGATPSFGAAPDIVNVALNPDVFGNLPIMIAADKGYFTQQNLDVRIQKITGSSLTQLPSLARGSIDIAPMGLGPGFFNQYAGGFDVKLVASMNETHAGWNDDSWIMVRQDVWDAGTIRKLSDLRGKTIDGYVAGAPPNMLIKQTLAKAGLTTSDVVFSERMKTAADAVAFYTNKVIEVSPAFEPTATQLELQHLAHKWLSTHDIMPDYQETYLAASSAFVSAHHDVIARFLVAYLMAARDIDRTNGKWTPALVTTEAKWSEQSEATVAQIPTPVYAGEFGAINQTSVAEQQAFWVSQGLVKQPVAIPLIVDASMLNEARRQLKIR
jgi:ABC-type nitrate/sulfonate/bicarbonate transport system substrate-binding protein